MQMVWLNARHAPTLVMANMTDSFPSIILVAAVMGACVIGGMLWLAKRRWEPALRQLTSVVEREMQRAEQSAQALQAGMHVQAQRAQRQSASVHGAIAGVRALHNITEDLDQCATDLKHLAHLMADEASSRRTAPGIAEHVVTSAKQIALTADQARQTYRRLQTSVNQLVAEATSMQDFGEEAEQHARELTGMMERLRQGIQPRRPKSPAPMKLPNAERSRHEEPPIRRDEPPARREEPLPPRRVAHREPPPPPDWSVEAPISPREPSERRRDMPERERLREREHERDRYAEDVPPARRPTHRRGEDSAAEERGSDRPTHRRDEGAPPHHSMRPPERDDPRYRRVANEDASGWLSDQERPSVNPRPNPRGRPNDDRWRA